ncbi:uncharacterized protein A1O9_08437 [Exophiala aquamarina CBS 119918]|uniref:Cytochrome P450 oxidoreductase n=1 Tax=Exophiala aquamarina CBS 119918 TaxID=1182545 RepID=A0A072P7I4_9EURO|nr:uncharacterized protein A1O9_08437 [Exophiala aquamarina CBS 119918]KEF55687.1 hypothetical protein A1O9_08437 [Exophiala aquamarina CBS 119918]
MTGTKFHIFDSQQTASLIFGKSREFVFEPILASMMENGMNLPMEDRPKFQVPLGPQDRESSNEHLSKSFVSVNHSIWLKYLTGDPLDNIMEKYVEHFEEELNCLPIISGSEWTTLDLHELMRKVIFEASVKTFFGLRLSTYWSDMWEDWKKFNDATYAGVRSNMAYYFQSGAYAARKRMLEAFEKWLEQQDGSWSPTNNIWDSSWGLKMNWERDVLARRYKFSQRGRACLQASFLFVIVTNSAPMATWFLKNVLDSPSRLQRFRSETRSMLSVAGTSPNISLKVDFPALRSSQFIQGLWKESLRLGSASAAARVVRKNTTLEGYRIKQGSVVLLPVQLMHSNPEAFLEPQLFDPDRWVFDQDDKLQLEVHKRRNLNLRSFGGGAGLCSGRFVAEQEILSIGAAMLLLFDIDIETPAGFQLNPRSIGIMGPMKAVRARIRRRKQE